MGERREGIGWGGRWREERVTEGRGKGVDKGREERGGTEGEERGKGGENGGVGERRKRWGGNEGAEKKGRREKEK